MKKKIIVMLFASAAFSAGMFVVATTANASTTPLKYGVWLPYWQGQNGAANIAQNLDALDEVSPFSYEIGSGGTLIDDLNISNGSWAPWFSAVREDGIKILPTIADFDGNGIYNMLSNTTMRQAEETRIATLVKNQNFDGIDIDFESMTGDTRPYYSLFIEGLAERLHPTGKELTCTVEARTPPVDLYQVIPTDIVYPENYTVLNQYCDEVRVMAYDEDTIDVELNAVKGDGQLYAPVADPDWIKQVLSDTLPYINPKKVMLGVPTYGYEYEVAWNDGVSTYQRVRAFDYLDAMARAASLGITPTRNNADELSFVYTSSTYIQEPPILVTDVLSTEPVIFKPPTVATAGTSTLSANIATAFAAGDGTSSTTDSSAPMTTFFVSFPDATSIADEIAIAKADGLRGVMLFKADGDIDPATWQYMK